MAARLVTICDAVAAAITAARPLGDITTVTRGYLPSVDIEEVTGRTAFVFPLRFGQVETLTRGEDLNEYAVGVLVVERCEASGDPPADWVDAAVAWVETQVYDLLSDARVRPAELAAIGVWPETAEVASAYDPELLRENKLFWSEVAVTFRREE